MQLSVKKGEHAGFPSCGATFDYMKGKDPTSRPNPRGKELFSSRRFLNDASKIHAPSPPGSRNGSPTPAALVPEERGPRIWNHLPSPRATMSALPANREL